MRLIKAAIIASNDIGKPPVKAYLINSWINRPESMLTQFVKSAVFVMPGLSDISKTFADIEKFNPDVLFFFTHINWPLQYLFQAISELRKKIPDLVLSVAADSVAKISLEDAKQYGIDFVFRGDIELNFEEMLRGMISEGLRSHSEPQFLCDWGTLQTLDEIPSPILAGNIDLSSAEKMQIDFGRGCPNSCAYCPIGEIKPRYFSVQRVKNEICYVLNHAPHIRKIQLQASDIFSDETYLILSEIRRMPLSRKIKFESYTHSGFRHSDEKIRLADSDIFSIRIGVQSFNPKSLQAVNRRNDANESKNNILRLRRLAPHADISVELIMGLPYETEETWFDVLEWVFEENLKLFVNHLFVPPESILANSSEGRKYEIFKDVPYFAVKTNVLSAAELTALSAKTRKIVFVMNVIHASKALEKAFYNFAAGFSCKFPYLTLAEKIAETLLSDKSTRKWAKEGMTRMSQHTFSAGYPVCFSRENILGAAHVFKKVFAEAAGSWSQ